MEGPRSPTGRRQGDAWAPGQRRREGNGTDESAPHSQPQAEKPPLGSERAGPGSLTALLPSAAPERPPFPQHLPTRSSQEGCSPPSIQTLRPHGRARRLQTLNLLQLRPQQNWVSQVSCLGFLRLAGLGLSMLSFLLKLKPILIQSVTPQGNDLDQSAAGMLSARERRSHASPMAQHGGTACLPGGLPREVTEQQASAVHRAHPLQAIPSCSLGRGVDNKAHTDPRSLA